MLQWAMEHEPPAPQLLIGGDKDYIPTVKELTSLGYMVLVAYNKQAGADVQ